MLRLWRRSGTSRLNGGAFQFLDNTNEFAGVSNQVIRRNRFKAFRLETPGDAATCDGGISCSLDIHAAVPDHERIFRSSLCIGSQLDNADRIRLLCHEAVAPVYPIEALGKSEGTDDNGTVAEMLVRHNGHLG